MCWSVLLRNQRYILYLATDGLYGAFLLIMSEEAGLLNKIFGRAHTLVAGWMFEPRFCGHTYVCAPIRVGQATPVIYLNSQKSPP